MLLRVSTKENVEVPYQWISPQRCII